MAKNLLKIENVYFAFVKIDKPQKNKFDASGLLKEFGATVVLSKEQRKQFKEQKLNKTVKEVDTADFESKYKFAPPYPDQDEQYILQVTKKATYQDGNLKAEWTFPKAYFEKEGSIVLSNATLIGNGSFGDVRLELNYNEKLGQTNVSLDSVLIKRHIPYESKGDEWASAAGVPTYVEAPTPTPSTSHAPPADMGDDLPF